MLTQILHFAAATLVDNGRVSIWVPTANDEDGELGIPQHEAMEVVSCCVQRFNKCMLRPPPFPPLPPALTTIRVKKTAHLPSHCWHRD